VAKDAIIIGTIESQVEPGSVTPPIVPLTSRRAGILLGAVDWVSPSSPRAFARLERDLTHIRSFAPGGVTQGTPHLGRDPAGQAADDIEQIGLGLMTRLNEIARDIHGRMQIREGEPLAELVLAGDVESYGPEIWQLTYSVAQEPERGDFWTTHIPRPRYTQLWPPEKGQSRTLAEIDYPAGATPLRDMLLAHDPKLEAIRGASPAMARAADAILRGDLEHVLAADALPYFRSALGALAGSNKEQIAVISVETGFEWVLAPPPEESVREDRPPGAPTLERPPGAPALQKPPR